MVLKLSHSAFCRIKTSATASILFILGGVINVEAQTAPAAVDGNRLALVIGQSEYSGAPLRNVNDPNLISDSLATAGFSVEIGKDLEKQSIAEKLSILADKAQLLGENTTLLLYLTGRFVQLDGDNLFLPVGTKIDTAASASLNGFSINSLVSFLKGIPVKSRVIVLDGNPPPASLTKEKTYSPGLMKIEPQEGFLISYNQRPGALLLENDDAISVYAQGFLEAMVTPTRDFSDVFQIIRKRVFDKTQGALQPFSVENLLIKNFSFYNPVAGTISMDQYYVSDTETADIKSLPRDEAYKKVISIDSIQSYQNFLKAFPDDEAAEVVKYNLTTRRESEMWAKALQLDTPESYWTYIQSYPSGGNVKVARYRLERMGEMDFAPPSNFQPIIYEDIPPPLTQYEVLGPSTGSPLREPPHAPRLNISAVPVGVAATVAAVAGFGVARAMSGQSSGAQTAPSLRPQWAATPPLNTTVSGARISPTVSNTARPVTPSQGLVISPPVSASRPMPIAPPPGQINVPQGASPQVVRPIAGPGSNGQSSPPSIGSSVSAAPSQASTLVVKPLSPATQLRPVGAPIGGPVGIVGGSGTPGVVPIAVSPAGTTGGAMKPIVPVIPNNSMQPRISAQGAPPVGIRQPIAQPQGRIVAPVQQRVQRQIAPQQQMMQQRVIQAPPRAAAPARPTCTPQMRQARQC
jgi:hypothetical protein